MKTYIAFLRGINVAGHNSITMDELVKAMTEGWFHNVKSYIQSGNLIFQSDIKEPSDVNWEMKKIITRHFSLQIDIVIRTISDLEKTINKCPFQSTEEIDVYASLLSGRPDAVSISILKEKFPEHDDYILGDWVVYIRVPAKTYWRSVYSNNALEKVFKVRATTRKIEVLQKVLELGKGK